MLVARKKKISLIIILSILVLALVGCKSKESGVDIYDFTNQKPDQIDPWVYIKDTNISSDNALISLASSASELGIIIGITGIIFSIIIMAIRIIMSSDPKKRSEIKQEAILKCIIAIMIYSIPLWLGIFKLLGDAFV